MAGKRKAKRVTVPCEDLSKPSPWRLQHGWFDEGVRGKDPDTGTPILHRRAVDTLGMMLANGTITREMHEAGCMFRTAFRTAALDGMRTSALLYLPSSQAGLTLSERQAAARSRLAEALALLGGADSPGGSCLWHVVGLEHSLREWATHRGWSGRPVHHVQAQGMLVAALGVLAVHYGLVPRRTAA
ncbi:hypothetical protein GXW77_09345 [Roseomonas alkaliterrae]|uniref:DUF6456 domain-containing protein n=1 Tax=Neoroseomonas alkaliterrae TaxID=1452450 RepID=A0A840XUZ5_9PROT|nr:DUF6456 domain-containing protein [Neoroseomonas alkaliterrae]MBB5691716.1 hypothetical protein [Neoroseomonas alkaliterrae]MBR0676376.1 hypothetical protein [Neoroseomonas alkaliterrae]